jgi:hypothetical protein
MADVRVPVTMVFAKIKATTPVLFEELERALYGYLENENRVLIGAPVQMVQLAQGRTQVAREFAELASGCAAEAEKLSRQLALKGV